MSDHTVIFLLPGSIAAIFTTCFADVKNEHSFTNLYNNVLYENIKHENMLNNCYDTIKAKQFYYGVTIAFLKKKCITNLPETFTVLKNCCALFFDGTHE